MIKRGGVGLGFVHNNIWRGGIDSIMCDVFEVG